MSFLQPAMLAALPLVALPIIIHLINQRRYQTVRWAAMMFLLAANRMSRGYARVRQWLILACRMLAVAGLTVAVSRPLAGGWLGLAAGGRPDTTILLLDRSPSMRQQGAGVTTSKLDTGREQLARSLATLGSGRWVLIDSGSVRPRELDSAEALRTAPGTEATSASADLPAMLQAAHAYIRDNKSGRTEIWICSDLRENDWNAESGRWPTLRDAFLEFPQGVRFHLLAYPQPDPANLSVRVTEVRRVPAGDSADLLVTIRLTREGGGEEKQTVPLQLVIDGARSEVSVEMAGGQYELKDHRIPLGPNRERGWGMVSLPVDGNPADNDAYFAYDRPAPRRAVIVADDRQAARPLELAASIAPDPSVACSAEVVGAEQVATLDWESLALLVWQADLPVGDAAQRVRSFVERGGQVVLFPPRDPGRSRFLGAGWSAWADARGDTNVVSWRGDQDLLAQTQSGAALPVGRLEVRRYCGVTGEFTTLASLKGGIPLLVRVPTSRGGVYFCATTAVPGDSSLATEGVVLYALVQRGMAAGAAVLGNTRQLVAGAAPPPGEDPTRWTRLAAADEAVSTDYPLHRGVYRSGERLLSVNRAASEDGAPVLTEGQVARLFRGLDFARVDDRAGNIDSLIQEVWRLFLVAMMMALVVEAGLCLPGRPRRAGVAS